MRLIWKAFIITMILGCEYCSSVAEAETLDSEMIAAGGEDVDITRDGMTTLELEKLAEFPPPVRGSYLQGETVTSDGLLMAFTVVEGGDNPLLMLDAETWQMVSSRTEDLSHANDMCYVPATGEINILPMDSPQIIVLDEDTLNVKRTIETPQTYHAIGYDENGFAAIYASGKGKDKRLMLMQQLLLEKLQLRHLQRQQK